MLQSKNMNENLSPIQKLNKRINSLYLYKAPKIVYQTNILQNTFQFSEPMECFESFRVVCKTWKSAVETIQFDPNWHTLDAEEEIFPHERNGKFPAFFTKYAKAFLSIKFHVDEAEFTQCNKAFILNNFTKLKSIIIAWLPESNDSTAFNMFLFTLFQNSQNTLQNIVYHTWEETFTFPSIVLPNVCHFVLNLFETENFDSISMIPSTVCPNLEEFRIWGIEDTPNLLEYLEENFLKHFVYSTNISTLDHIELKFCHIKPDQLTQNIYPSIQVLALDVELDLRFDDYKNILTSFPNLTSITFFHDSEYKNLDSLLESLSPGNPNIWNERISIISYFEEKNIKIISETEIDHIVIQLQDEGDENWYFEFTL